MQGSAQTPRAQLFIRPFCLWPFVFAALSAWNTHCLHCQTFVTQMLLPPVFLHCTLEGS